MIDITDDQIIKAMKDRIPDFTKKWLPQYTGTEEQAVQGSGVSTFGIAGVLSNNLLIPVKCSELRSRLRKLEKKGRVVSSKDNTNSISWLPVGIIAELRECVE